MSKTVYSNHGKFQNGDQHHHRPRKKKNPRKLLLILVGIVLALVLLIAAGLALFFGGNEKAEEDFQALSAQVQLAEETAASTTAPASTTASTAATTVPTVPAETQPTILPQYADLYNANNEMIGWIKIEGTKIDYPVMHTPNDPQKYLHKSFAQTDSYPGVPFIDAGCTMESQNRLIYAHNMPNGTMFRDLMKYQEKTFWQKHPTITFNTLYEEQEYEIVAAFNDRVYYQRETGMFKFYQFIDPATKEEFDAGIAAMKDKALYDTGVTAEYGDQLITLVTCAYHTDHGRFVVLARKK